MIMLLISCYEYEKSIPIYNYDFPNDIHVNTVEEALQWMIHNISYKYKENNYTQTPEETFKLKTGDCDDFSMLLAYIFYTKLHLKDIDIVITSSHAFIYSGDLQLFIEPQAGIFQPPQSYFNKYDIINFISYPIALGRLLN